MKIDVKVIGAQVVINMLKKQAAKIENELNKKLLICAIKVESDAKKNAPVLTGRLRSSITHEVKSGIGKVGTNVEYAPYQEFGTSKMKAHPYLYPALQGNFNFIKKTLCGAVVSVLKK